MCVCIYIYTYIRIYIYIYTSFSAYQLKCSHSRILLGACDASDKLLSDSAPAPCEQYFC